jgi:hypothetical protein
MKTEGLLVLGMLLLAAHGYVVRRASGLGYLETLRAATPRQLGRLRSPWWASVLLVFGVVLGLWGCLRLYGFVR